MKQIIVSISKIFIVVLIANVSYARYLDLEIKPDSITNERKDKINYQDLGVASIAILDIGGSSETSRDGIVTREGILEDLLTNTKLKIYDRSNLPFLLKEKAYSDAGILEDSIIQKEFKLRKIDAVLVGKILINGCDDYERKELDGSFTRYCIYNFGMSLQLISTTDGRILAQKTHALSSRNIMKKAIFVDGRKVAGSPNYYEDKIPNSSAVIEIVYNELMDAFIEGNKLYEKAARIRSKY